MTPLSNVFLKMGDTDGARQFAPTNTPGDWLNPPFEVSLVPPYDKEPFPSNAMIRYIITPSDRYSLSLNKDHVFPVGGIGWPTPNPAPNSFSIRARNSDTAASNQTHGNMASFFWLAIAENVTRSPTANVGNVTSVPLNQTFIGQPANFPATQQTGDHQVLPSFFCPALGNVPPNLQFQQNGSYVFPKTFGTAAFPAPPNPNRPLVFATANNVGCGVSPYLPAHNAAAVALVVDQVPGPGSLSAISPTGFNLIARNSDVAGTCGFNWVALLQLFGTPAHPDVPVLPLGAQTPVDLMVDTGEVFGPGGSEINFTQAGTQGDWFSAEVQFSKPFALEPVVLITPHFPPPYFGAPGSNPSGCAPVAMAQNVTRFGFTLAAHNTDTNNVGGNASFYWVAFGF